VIWGWVVDESMTDEVRVTVIATGFSENQHAKLPSAERRVAVQVAAGGNRGGSRQPQTREMASGFDLSHDDYDIPTFFKNAD
jgi:cell division GTPase FtsZ